MKAVLILVAALALAGCEHMYGGMDGGRRVAQAEPSQQELTTLAARRLSLERWSTEGMSVRISDVGSSWRVHFSPADPSVLDGGAWVEISKATRRAGRFWFDS